jgi:uncharacterized protein (DUF433 family)
MNPRAAVKKTFAFRVAPDVLDQLGQRARACGASKTALAERYVLEGLRMDEHPLIGFRDGFMGRRPSLVGTRLDVNDVVRLIRLEGNSVPDAAAYLEIPTSHVEACLRYYAAYQREIDDWIARADAVSTRERDLCERQQKLAG